MLTLDQIRIRDPFVLPVPDEDTYYLYGTTDKNVWSGDPVGFDCYRSSDLRTWEGPIPAFRPSDPFWANSQFWAPEVYAWRGQYFMFATFAADNEYGVHARGTQVLVADSPSGPFSAWSEGPITPDGWQCLDGTLHIDDDGLPWVVFCHEWLQIGDGAIYAQRLTTDLKAATGVPRLLFHASEAPWTTPVTRDEHRGYVTDGPWLVRTNTELIMLWSSQSHTGYAIGVARSASGNVLGLWEHDLEPLWDADGGHGMTFTDTSGQQLLALHRPNTTPLERAEFHVVELGSSHRSVDKQA